MLTLMPRDLDQSLPIGRFGAGDLPVVHGVDAFRRAVMEPAAPDCVLHHAPDHFVDVVPAGLVPGISIFGPGRSVNADMHENPLHRVRAVSSLALEGAVLSPDSMAVLSPARGFFDASVGNLAIWQGLLSHADRHFIEIAPDDSGAPRWAFADPAAGIDTIDAVALPVGGIGCANYGHFLYDGLPAAMLHADLLGEDVVIAGRPLLPWQSEILDALGLRERYVAITRPTRFRRIVTSDMIAFNVSYPSRFIRALFDRLRARFGVGAGARRLLVLRAHEGNRRVLANRAEIEAIAAAWGFETVHPERLDVAGQARLFAGAACVIGESGAALANLGFCDPGALVLELQPELFADGWTRAACSLLGHDWHIYVGATVPGGDAADGRGFVYRIEPDSFRAALRGAFGPAGRRGRVARGCGDESGPRHGTAGTFTIAPRGLAAGEIRFGAVPAGRVALLPKRAESAAVTETTLAEAVLIPSPFSILGGDGTVHAGAALPRSRAEAVTRRIAGSVAPLEAGGSVPLGRFLGESCGLALTRRFAGDAAPLAGPALTGPQAAALDALGLRSTYLTLEEGARIEFLRLARVVPSHRPGRFTRLAVERLRFLVEPYAACERIAILGDGGAGRIAIDGRDALRGRLRQDGFGILDVAAMRLDDAGLGLFDLAAVLAACRLLVIDDRAQAPLLGFCDPGATVIELGVEGWTGSDVAACCRLFSLEWRLVQGPAPRYAVLGDMARPAAPVLHSRIDLAGLAAAIARLSAGGSRSWRSGPGGAEA